MFNFAQALGRPYWMGVLLVATWTSLGAAQDASSFSSAEIGNPRPIGSTEIDGEVITVTAGGADIGGSADQFRFVYLTLTNDFDFKVQVQSLGVSDAWAKAILMARQNLGANSVFVGAAATPNLAGCFYQSRSIVGGNSSLSGSFPANGSSTWLRLQRIGTVFVAYAGMDGHRWQPLATNTLFADAGTWYVGLAVTSHNTNRTTTAQFRHWSEAQDGIIPGISLEREPLGPSTRRTGLVISEIMYHPGPWATNKALEFVELFNSNPFFEDISGYRLSGDVDYLFPEGTVLPGGGFVVVARNPADVTSVYGLAQVLGPYTNTPARSGILRLRDKTDAIFLEVPYSYFAPWPVAADGTGHSLVLARPSFGEADPRAWSASTFLGGSPGGLDPECPSPLRNVFINEVLLNPKPGDTAYIELYSHQTEAVDISGCRLATRASNRLFEIPAGTEIAPGGYVCFTDSQMVLSLQRAGDTLDFISPDGAQILDAVSFEAQASGIAIGRFPNGASEWYPLSKPTPGFPNDPILARDIVINEIMYHPISDAEDDEYVELYNCGTNAVNVGLWRFVAGIDFTFPPQTTIPAGGFLVVAKNQERLWTNYPNLNNQNTIGNFLGKLSNGGERLALAKPELTPAGPGLSATTNYVIVDEVTYGVGGHWGRWADGGGSSLELVDPRSNRRLADNWADSDETAKAPWTAFEYTGVLDNGYGAVDSLHVLMLEAGECLLDDVEVVLSGTTNNLISNPTFESGQVNWFLQGDHIQSSVQTSGGFESAGCLHIRATSRGDTGANRIRAILKNTSNLVPGATATLRAKARWLCGHPEILLRLKGNYLEAYGRLSLPRNLGTPGAPNSRAVVNAAPAIYEVAHHPPLPANYQTVVVTARIHDPDGLSQWVLKYRVDPATNYVAAPFRDDGAEGDALANDGIYSALIPGQAQNKIVAFYLEAIDTSPSALVGRFPALAPNKELLVRFGEFVIPSSFGTYRLWFSQKTIDAWNRHLTLSNEEMDGTFVYGNHRVVYNAGVRYSGSPWHQSYYTSPTGTSGSMAIQLPGDDRVLGTDNFNKIHAPGNSPGDDSTVQREQIAYWMVRQLGLPWNYQRYVSFYVNGFRHGTLYEDTQVPGAEVIEEHFPQDPDGPLYKLNGWYEFTFTSSGNMVFNLVSWCTMNNYLDSNGAKRVASYRWNWSPRAMHGTANDYTELFRLIDAASTPSGDALSANLSAVADMEQWLRTFAIEHAVGNWDSFGHQNAQNMFAYKPTKDKWKLLIWDFNIVLGGSAYGPSGDSMFQFYGADFNMGKIYSDSRLMRSYLRHLKEIGETVFTGNRAASVIDARYAAFKASGLNPSSPQPIKDYINARRGYLSSLLRNYAVDLTVYPPAADGTATDHNVLTLMGTAPVEAKRITVNGIEYPLTWISVVTWQLRIPLVARTNDLQLQAFDVNGKPLTNGTRQITYVYNGPLESPLEHLVINEILYQPPLPGAEFVEIFNTSSQCAFDLNNVRLAGVDFNFPSGAFIAPQDYAVVTKDHASFLRAYPNATGWVGDFNGRLDPKGETLTLLRVDPNPINNVVFDTVTYDNQPPWPANANQPGVSLQLQDPQSDRREPSSWAAANPKDYTEPQWRQVCVTGTATNSPLLLYHSPFQALPDPTDFSGEWDGTINFPGQPYPMRVVLGRQGSNAWTGQFLGSTITMPLAVVTVNTTNIVFTLTTNPGDGRFSGRLSPDGRTITGTFTATDTPTSSFTLRRMIDPSFIWGGDVYIDDLKLVAGSTAEVGGNLIRNGDFEASLEGSWMVASNHVASAISLDVKRSGNSSLHLVASRGGADVDTAIWQDIESLVPGQVYTLSYWYLPTTHGVDLTARLVDHSIESVHSIVPEKLATPGAPNAVIPPTTAAPGLLIYVNEWMAGNTRTLADPADGQYQDWIELFNPGSMAVDLTGCTLSDNPTNKTKWVFPPGTQIPAHGYLLIWADEETGQNGRTGDLHANFKLSQQGETIGLYAPDGRTIDFVDFGPQTADVSQGRLWGDPTGALQFFQKPTPRSQNPGPPEPPVAVRILAMDLLSPRAIQITWSSQMGGVYQVQTTDSLTPAQWINLGAPVVATNGAAQFKDESTASGALRFYRLMWIR